MKKKSPIPDKVLKVSSEVAWEHSKGNMEKYIQYYILSIRVFIELCLAPEKNKK